MTLKKETNTQNSSDCSENKQTVPAAVNTAIAEETSPPGSIDGLPRKLRSVFRSGYLGTVSMTELYDTVYRSSPPIIDGLLYPGTYLFVGAPKLGKSFLMT